MPVDNKPVACAIFAHCFTCTKDLSAVKNISNALTQRSIAVLRFDFTGLGESEGDFSDTNFSSNVDDLIAASEFLKGEYEAPGILIGHSLGGAAVLRAALQIKSVKAVAVVGAPFDPAHIKELLMDDIKVIESKGSATVSIGGRPFKIKKEFIDDILQSNPQEKISGIKKALLILHSPEDNIVGIENAGMIYKAAKHPKSFISLDGADHLLSKKEDSLYAGEVIASWAQRYLDIPQSKPISTNKQVVVRIGEDSLTTEIKSGDHLLLADEPESVGGNNLGPSPYDFLLSGLGACTAMTVRMYATRKKIRLNEIRVHLQHSREYAKDCENYQNTSSKIDKIERIIEFEGELTADQKTRLLEIANKCPVHKTLLSDIEINTRLNN